MLDFLHDNHCNLLRDLNLSCVSVSKLGECSAVVTDRATPLDNCWSFIDRTVEPTCGPFVNQRVIFNGH